MRLPVVSAGAPIPEALVSRATRVLGAAVVSAWGMSENGAVTTTCPGDPVALTTGTDGCALPGMEVRVLGLDGLPVPPGETGDLWVRGCSNFVGYFKRPQTRTFDDDGWFATQPPYYDRLASLLRPGGLLVMSNWFLLEHAVTGESPLDWSQFAGESWAADVTNYASILAADSRYDVSFVQRPAFALATRRGDG